MKAKLLFLDDDPRRHSVFRGCMLGGKT